MVYSTLVRNLTLTLLLSLFVTSCSSNGMSEKHFNISGSASNCISDVGLKSLSEGASSYEVNLLCQIDSLCLPRDYYDPISQYDSTIVIQAYLHPRLIKAWVHGLGSLALDGGELGREYFIIQNEYARGGSLEMALQEMADLCNAAFEESKHKINWFRRLFQNGAIREIDEVMDITMSYLTPREGIIGSINKPFFLFGCWCIRMTGSTSRGLLLMITLFAFFILLFFFWAFGRIRKQKKTLFLLVVVDILMWIMFLFIFYYSFRVGKPIQENLFVLKNVYHLDGISSLQSAYSAFVFHHTSFVLVFFAALAYYATKYLSFHAGLKMAEQNGTIEEYGEQVGHDITESNDPLGPIKNALLVLAIFIFIDKSIVIGFLCFFTLKAFLFSAHITPINKRLVFKSKQNILLLVLLTAAIVSILIAPNLHTRRIDNRYPPKHLDSVSYFCGISLGDFLKKNGAGDYIKQLDSAQVNDGFQNYMACRNHMINTQPKVYTFPDLKNLIEDLEKNPSMHSEISFQIGATVARNLYVNGYTPELKPDLFVQGMFDYIQGNQLKFSLTRFNEVLKKHKAIYGLYQEADNKEAASRFLDDNSLNNGVIYMPSGLQYKVIKLGNSRMATSTSMVKFHYFEYTLGGDIVSSTPNAQYHNLNRLPSDFAKALCQIGEDGEIITWIPSQLHEGMKTHGKPGELTALEIRVEKVLY